MSDLAAMVHTCPSAQTKLGPALLRTYVSVDVVEGLDVDRDTFDKFSARSVHLSVSLPQTHTHVPAHTHAHTCMHASIPKY